jgi:hypothetical protein
MRLWKKRWEEELDAKIPALDEKVKNAPIVTAQKQEQQEKQENQGNQSFFVRTSEVFYAYKKRIYAGVATLAAAFLALCVALPLFNAPVNESVISVEINPCAVFSVDKKGFVMAVVAGNSDADVILSGGRAEKMKGKTIEQATEVFVDYAARLGYLNLSATDKTSAVRVSGCGNEKALKRVGEKLEAYFQEKGAYAAVIKESVSSEELCSRVGMEVKENIEEFAANLKELPTLFTQREIDTEEEIQGNLTEIAANLLARNKAKILQNALDIAEIDALNTQIEEHDDNGGFFFKDYWHIKDEEYTGDFAELLLQMEEKLATYKENYGVLLESWLDLQTVLFDYSNYTDNALEAYIDELLVDFDSPTLFIHYLTISSLLENVGVKVPSTDIEDWIYNFGTYLDDEFARLAQEAKQLYYETRVTLTENVYYNYTHALEEEYGSLSAYWNSLQN